MSLWKVNEGTQVKHGGVLYAAGETFEADEVGPVAQYVTEVVPEKAKASAPNKARKSSPNKSK